MLNKLKAIAEKEKYKLEIFRIDRLKSLKQDLEQLLIEPHLHSKQRGNIERNIKTLDSFPAKYTSVVIFAVPRGDNTLTTAKEYLASTIKEAGFAIKIPSGLPLKRLAVQSGLAEYGRNNIAYVSGMGSWLQLAVFLTTIPCESDNWREQPVMSKTCEDCDLCVTSCPHGAISKDRFLLHREKCKNCPECQKCCPLNKGIIG